MKNCNNPRVGAITAFAAVMIAGSALAADYNWTGNGDGHSWSDVNNWTNEAGVAVAPDSSTSQPYSYSFTVGDSGLCVTQDISGSILVNRLTIENTADNAAVVEIASKENGCLLDFSANATVDVPAGATLSGRLTPIAGPINRLPRTARAGSCSTSCAVRGRSVFSI